MDIDSDGVDLDNTYRYTNNNNLTGTVTIPDIELAVISGFGFEFGNLTPDTIYELDNYSLLQVSVPEIAGNENLEGDDLDGMKMAKKTNFGSVSYDMCREKNKYALEILSQRQLLPAGTPSHTHEPYRYINPDNESKVKSYNIDMNAIMGYEYRPLIQKVKNLQASAGIGGGKIQSLEFKMDKSKVIDGGNISSPLVNKKWYCDNKNNVLLDANEENSCEFGNYGVRDPITYPGSIDIGNYDQPFYNDCKICDPYDGTLPKVEIKKGRGVCGRCTSNGYCLEPKCKPGYYFNMTRCVKCGDIQYAHSDYSGLEEDNAANIKCTNSNNSMFNKVTINVDLPIRDIDSNNRNVYQGLTSDGGSYELIPEDDGGGNTPPPCTTEPDVNLNCYGPGDHASGGPSRSIEKLIDVRNFKYDNSQDAYFKPGVLLSPDEQDKSNAAYRGETSDGVPEGAIIREGGIRSQTGICNVKPNREGSRFITDTSSCEPWIDSICDNKLSDITIDCLYHADSDECKSDMNCYWTDAIDIVQNPENCSPKDIDINKNINDDTYVSRLSAKLSDQSICPSKPANIINKKYSTEGDVGYIATNPNTWGIREYVEKNATCNQNLYQELNKVNAEVNHNSNIYYNKIINMKDNLNLSWVNENLANNTPTLLNADLKHTNTATYKYHKCGYPCMDGYRLKENYGESGDVCEPCGISDANFQSSEDTTCSRDGIYKNIQCKQGFVHSPGRAAYENEEYGTYHSSINDTCIDCKTGLDDDEKRYIAQDDTDGNRFYTCSKYKEKEDGSIKILDLTIDKCSGSDPLVDEAFNYNALIKGKCELMTDSGLKEIDYLKDTYNKCGSCNDNASTTREECILNDKEWTGPIDSTEEPLRWDNGICTDAEGETSHIFKTAGTCNAGYYVWTQDKCEPCTGRWTRGSAEDDYNVIFTKDNLAGKMCPHIEPEIKNMSNDIDIERTGDSVDDVVMDTEGDAGNNYIKTTTKDDAPGPKIHTLYGVQAAASLTNKGYVPGYDPDAGNGRKVYFKRNNSWGSVNNVLLEDPAICERSISVQIGDGQSADGRKNLNDAVWPDTWMGKAHAHDHYGGWTHYGKPRTRFPSQMGWVAPTSENYTMTDTAGLSNYSRNHSTHSTCTTEENCAIEGDRNIPQTTAPVLYSPRKWVEPGTTGQSSSGGTGDLQVSTKGRWLENSGGEKYYILPDEKGPQDESSEHPLGQMHNATQWKNMWDIIIRYGWLGYRGWEEGVLNYDQTSNLDGNYARDFNIREGDIPGGHRQKDAIYAGRVGEILDIDDDLHDQYGDISGPPFRTIRGKYADRGLKSITRSKSAEYGHMDNATYRSRHSNILSKIPKYLSDGLGGGGKLGGDLSYAASTVEVDRVEHGIPGACFVSRAAPDPNVDSNMVYGKTDQQVWTGKALWGIKELENGEEDFLKRGDVGETTTGDETEPILPKNDGYALEGRNKNRYRTGYVALQDGIPHEIGKVNVHPNASTIAEEECQDGLYHDVTAAANLGGLQAEALNGISQRWRTDLRNTHCFGGISPDGRPDVWQNDEITNPVVTYEDTTPVHHINDEGSHGAILEGPEDPGSDWDNWPNVSEEEGWSVHTRDPTTWLGQDLWHLENVDGSIYNPWAEASLYCAMNNRGRYYSGPLMTWNRHEGLSGTGHPIGGDVYMSTGGSTGSLGQTTNRYENTTNTPSDAISWHYGASNGYKDIWVVPEGFQNYEMSAPGLPGDGVRVGSGGSVERTGDTYISNVCGRLSNPYVGSEDWHIDGMFGGEGHMKCLPGAGGTKAETPQSRDPDLPSNCENSPDRPTNSTCQRWSCSGVSGPGCSWQDSSSTKNKTDLLNYETTGVHSDPIKKSMGSSADGRHSKVQDRELKSCSDYCHDEDECGGFWFYNYRDYSGGSLPKHKTQLYGGEDRRSSSGGRFAGRCCRKKFISNPDGLTGGEDYNIKVPILPDTITEGSDTSTGNFYFPYETFIQCPRDPIYATLEDKINGTSIIKEEGKDQIRRTNTYDDLMLARPGPDGQNNLSESKTVIGQLKAAGGTELEEDTLVVSSSAKKDLQDTFNDRQLFSKARHHSPGGKEEWFGAQKYDPRCLFEAGEVNKKSRRETLEHAQKVKERKYNSLGHYGRNTVGGVQYGGETVGTHLNNTGEDVDAQTATGGWDGHIKLVESESDGGTDAWKVNGEPNITKYARGADVGHSIVSTNDLDLDFKHGKAAHKTDNGLNYLYYEKIDGNDLPISEMDDNRKRLTARTLSETNPTLSFKLKAEHLAPDYRLVGLNDDHDRCEYGDGTGVTGMDCGRTPIALLQSSEQQQR